MLVCVCTGLYRGDDEINLEQLYWAVMFKGAMAVVDGNVMAINPADEPRTHMFIWNNIFFSLGFDVKDHYKVGYLIWIAKFFRAEKWNF